MKNVKKLLICIICALSVVLSSVVPVFATSPGGNTAQIKAPKKIISLVFDDSSSMYNGGVNSWAEANYATQVFAALMDPQDELYITYMSELTSGEIDLSDPQAAVDKIRTKKSRWSGTPLESVEVAEERLENINESDPNAQFWLVVMTDGYFSGSRTYSDIEEACNDLKGKKMSNGTSLRVFYYGIGSGSAVVPADSEGGLDTVNSDNIVGSLNDVANTISGRLKYDSKDITFVDDKTIEVSSKIPLYSLSAFTQNSKAKVVSAKTENAEGNTLVLDFNNVSVQSPRPEDVFHEGSDPGYLELDGVGLYGNVSVISNKKQVIPAGKYTIEFSDPIDKESLVLMYQPSITLTLSLYKDGSEVQDYSEIVEGDDLEIRMTLIDPSSGDEMDLSLIPSGTDYTITEEGDNGKDTVSGLSMTVDDIEPGSYSFTGQMTIPGMAPVFSNTINIVVDKYKPQPKIHLTVIRKGNLQDDVVYDNVDGTDTLDILEVDDTIIVRAEAIDAKSGGPIDASRLHATENWNISYQVDGNEIGSKQSNEYRDIRLKVGDNLIVCDYEVAGLTAQESVKFEIQNPAVYSLEVDKDTGTFPRRKLNRKENPEEAPVIWIVRDEDLDRDGVGDGNPKRLTRNETTGARQLLLDSVTVERYDFGFLPNRVGFMNADVELVQNDDGSYSAVPRINTLKRFFFPYLITTGNYRVNTVLDANSMEQEVTVQVTGKLTDWIPLIIEIIFIWLFWRIMYMIFLKPKFAKNMILDLSVEKSGGGGARVELPGQNEQIPLKPYGDKPFSKKPAEVKIGTLGLTIKASAEGYPYFKSDEVPKDLHYSDGAVTAPSKKFKKVMSEVMTQKPDTVREYTLSTDPIFFASDNRTLYKLRINS